MSTLQNTMNAFASTSISGPASLGAAGRPRNVVAVIGTTGVGKSDLAVHLARSLRPTRDGVVLSADSMQLYKGLDVITNKMTPEEMRGVRHWGMDLVKPGEGSWEVGRWCSEADRQLDQLGEGTVGIVCGGTHYFIQHFLIPPESLSFERHKEATERAKRWEPPHPHPPTCCLAPELEKLLDTFWTDHPVWPGETEGNDKQAGAGPSTLKHTIENDGRLLALHRLLTAVDPKEAGRWHWRDGRKVRRGIERWWETNGGEVNSETTKEAGQGGRKARFRTLVFWVYEPLETLRPRLSKRVDKMVENGLLREIAELRGIATRLYGNPTATDHSEGIFQSIGFKEFANLNLDQEDPSSDPSFEAMLDRMQLSTHQYAKSQIKWIRKQLMPAIKEARSLGGDVEVYVVRGGQEGQELAAGILKSFLEEKPLPDMMQVGHPDAAELLADLAVPDERRVPDIAQRQQINQRRHCEICSTPENPTSIMLKDWDTHLRSKSHKMKATIQEAGGMKEWIRQQRERGIARKEERQAEALKNLSASEEPSKET